jgi:hypothetical protein
MLDIWGGLIVLTTVLPFERLPLRGQASKLTK